MRKDISKALAYTAKVLDAWLSHKIAYDRIPGLSVGLVYKGKLAYKRGFGYADLETQRKATPETCYRIASISKVFTAVAVLQLVERGKLCLDDPVAKYLPWFRVRTSKLDSKTITIRQILSHSAGVFRDGGTPHWETDEFPDLKVLKKSVSRATLVFETLAQFKYSNFGFALLGEVIKKVSGLNYESYVSRYIIRKLGLKSTAPDLTKWLLSHLATGYGRLIPDQERQHFPHIATKAYAPAAGFISNVIDLSKFLSAISLNRKGKNTLLAQDSKREMMREYWKTDEEGAGAYGLGLGIYPVATRNVIGHGGGFTGFSTRIFLDIENEVGVIALSNVIDPMKPLSVGMFETIYHFIDHSDLYHGMRASPPRKYEGAYRSRWGDRVVVRIDNALVAFDPQESSPMKQRALLKPLRKDEFTIETKDLFGSPGEVAKFVFGKKGEKTKLIWGSTPFERVND